MPRKLNAAPSGAGCLLALVAIVGLGGTALADDDTERKVKVAIAIARAKAQAEPDAVATAPAPRPALVPYAEGYTRAKDDQLPLVVYVGWDGPKVPNTASVRVESYASPDAGPMPGPAVVVAYPVGDRVLEEARITGKPGVREIEKATDAARKKMDAKPMPAKPAAPAPSSDYLIRGEAPPGFTAVKVCNGPGKPCTVYYVPTP